MKKQILLVAFCMLSLVAFAQPLFLNQKITYNREARFNDRVILADSLRLIPNAGVNRVLTSNSLGWATWQPISSLADTGLFKRGVGVNSIMDKRSFQSAGANSFTVGLGANSNVTATNAITIGENNFSGSVNNVTIGRESSNNGANGINLGAFNLNNANRNISIGDNVTIQNNDGIGIGSGVTVNSRNAIALGQNAVANITGQFALSDSIKHLKMKLNGQTNGQVLMTNGTTASWQTLPASLSLIQGNVTVRTSPLINITVNSSNIKYTKIGNLVFVYGTFDCNIPAANTLSRFRMAPPYVPISGSGGYWVGGGAGSSDFFALPVDVNVNIGDTDIEVRLRSTVTGFNMIFNVSFIYQTAL